MLRPVALFVGIVLCWLESGCGGPPPAPRTAADQAGTTSSTAAKPAGTAAGDLPADASQVPPPPASCSVIVERKTGGAAECTDDKTARGALAAALADHDETARDTKLAALDGCQKLPAGVVRALRAELGPPECADALVEPFLKQSSAGLRPDVRDALMGLGFAARASRLVRDPPKLSPPFDKAHVQAFVTGPLKRWIEGQAKAIYSVSLHGSSLEGYGKGVVAVEAGLADLRFVDVARSAPVPDEIAKDKELTEAYYVSLEQALESRKTRGRDAALVGLKKLAEVGVIADPRVERARKLLSELYAGRRIDALDSLLLPALGEPKLESDEERLAASLPTFYAEVMLSGADAARPAFLRALVERGLPVFARDALGKSKDTPAESTRLYARALLALGQRYWRAHDFAAAAEVLARAKLPRALGDEAGLVSGIAHALSGGPKDAAQMMLEGPSLPKGVGDVAELDKLGKGRGALAGMALFDAARLLEITRPENAPADYWKGIADRYERASKLLSDPARQKDAALRAKAARDTAATIH